MTRLLRLIARWTCENCQQNKHQMCPGMHCACCGTGW